MSLLRQTDQRQSLTLLLRSDSVTDSQPHDGYSILSVFALLSSSAKIHILGTGEVFGENLSKTHLSAIIRRVKAVG